jgi:hypothetical protein
MDADRLLFEIELAIFKLLGQRGEVSRNLAGRDDRFVARGLGERGAKRIQLGAEPLNAVVQIENQVATGDLPSLPLRQSQARDDLPQLFPAMRGQMVETDTPGWSHEVLVNLDGDPGGLPSCFRVGCHLRAPRQ